MNPVHDIQDLFPWVPDAHPIRVEVHKGRAGGNDVIVHDKARIIEGDDENPQKLKLKKTDGEVVNVKNSDIYRQRYFSWEFLKWRWQDYMTVFEAGEDKYMPLRFADLMDLDEDLSSIEEVKEALEGIDIDELDKETLETLDIDTEMIQDKIEELGSRQVLMADADYQRRWDDATESQIENTMDAWDKKSKLDKYLAPAVLVIVIVGEIIQSKQMAGAIQSQNEKITTLVENVGQGAFLMIGMRHPGFYFKVQSVKQNIADRVESLKSKVF